MPKNPYFRLFFAVLALAGCAGILHASADTLTFNPSTPVSLTCAKGGSGCNQATVTLTSSGSPDYYLITASTVPFWLQVGPMSGSASTNLPSLTFQTSAAAASLAVGSYSTSVQFTGPNITTVTLTVNLTVTDATAGLTVQQGTNYNTVWSMGTTFPSLSLTIDSNTTVPVPFTCTITSTATAVNVTNWLSPTTPISSIAYSWGTTIPLTVNPLAYMQALPGETLAATAVITYGSSSSKTVNITITAAPQAAVLSSFSPSSVPVIGAGPAGTVTIAINGMYFSQIAPTTKVFYTAGSTLSLCSGSCTVNVLNSQNLTVTIPYDATGAPFKTAGTLTIGVANGANPTAAQASTKTLPITTAPIINSITSAASFVEPALGAAPTVAPYDVISIFGTNFCPPSIALCATPMVALPDSAFFRYPTWLSPEGAIVGTHKLSVMFSKTSVANPAWANVPGYLLFANNNQINVLVPAGIAAQAGAGTVKVVVALDNSATAPAAGNSSAAYTVNVAAVDPGVFTLDTTGQGAILDAVSFALNTSSAPTTAGDFAAIYMTGLGIPNSNGADTPPNGGSNPPTTCLNPLGNPGTANTAPTGYMGAVNTSLSYVGFFAVPIGYTPPAPPWTTIDGAIIRSILLSLNVSPPCFGTAAELPVVTIGGVSATVQYAGFVSDAIAGLYQVNVLVPQGVGNGSAAQYPVVVTTGSATSIAAPPVKIWVQ